MWFVGAGKSNEKGMGRGICADGSIERVDGDRIFYRLTALRGTGAESTATKRDNFMTPFLFISLAILLATILSREGAVALTMGIVNVGVTAAWLFSVRINDALGETVADAGSADPRIHRVLVYGVVALALSLGRFAVLELPAALRGSGKGRQNFVGVGGGNGYDGRLHNDISQAIRSGSAGPEEGGVWVAGRGQAGRIAV